MYLDLKLYGKNSALHVIYSTSKPLGTLNFGHHCLGYHVMCFIFLLTTINVESHPSADLLGIWSSQEVKSGVPCGKKRKTAFETLDCQKQSCPLFQTFWDL